MTHIKNFHVTIPPLGEALKGEFLCEDAVQLHASVLRNCWTLYTWWIHHGSSGNAVQGGFTASLHVFTAAVSNHDRHLGLYTVENAYFALHRTYCLQLQGD